MLRSPSAGAVTAPLSQALGSLVLQVLAARALGAEGLGVFALLYGSIVLCTAASTGLVGDSLTVLDRRSSRIRAALQNWLLIVSLCAGSCAALVTWLAGLLPASTAVLFGVATVSFLVEDIFRRILMANMRFWSLPAVDGTSLVGSVLTLVVIDMVGGPLTVTDFMTALVAGQLAACLVALALLPRDDRFVVGLRPAAMAAVFRYGGWLAAQQSIRQGMLTGVRLLVTVLVSAAAYGHLEAARVYMAPAMLIVSGAGSFLMPMYVARRRLESDARIVARADAAAAGLLVATLCLGILATSTVSVFGGYITGGKFSIDSVAVFGWALYAAGTAASTPYSSMAAVVGRQSRVLALRLVEPTVALLLLAGMLATGLLGPSWAPYAVAIGGFVGALTVRQLVLVPLRSPAVTREPGSADNRPMAVTSAVAAP